MKTRRRRVGGEVGGRTVPLDLIDTIKRNVEAVATLVFDDRDLDRAFTDEHLLHSAIDPDAVLQVHDIISRLQRGETFERGSRCVSARPPESPLAPENLVIGENAKSRKLFAARRNEEASVENSDCEACWRYAIVVEQLVEALRLPGIVAENGGWDSIRDDELQSLDVALDRLRIAKGKNDLSGLAREIEPAEGFDRPERSFRRLEQLLPARGVFSAAAGEIDVVLCFRPGTIDFRPDVRAARNDEEGIAREKRANRRPLRLGVARCYLSVDGQNERNFGLARRPLSQQVEVPELGDVVAPELQPHGLRHAKTVDVEDSTPHTELGDIFDHRHLFESDRLEV
jgi:hypothetical protein